MLIKFLLISLLKRIIIPGLAISEFKPVSKLCFPSYFLIPMFFCCLVAQISDNLKGVLSIREIQQLFSVKIYSKVICLSKSSMCLTYLQSIVKTLGYELEILSVLSISQRVDFLNSLLKALLEYKGGCKISKHSYLLSNPFNLMQHRKALGLQSRSLLVSVALFSSHSIVIGLNIKDISLKTILDCCKDLWLNLSLEEEEFDYLLRKEAMRKFNEDNITLPFFSKLEGQLDYFRVLLYFELKSFLNFTDIINFSADEVVLRNNSNLTNLELELGFVKRDLPQFTKEVFVLPFDCKDDIVKTAYNQRKSFNSLKRFK